MVLHVLIGLFGFAFTFVTANETGCTVDGKTFAPGEQYDVPGSCGLNVCKGNNEWTQMPCGLVVTPAGWEYVPEDLSKGYPDCCGYSVPPCRIVPEVVDHVESYRGPYLRYPTLDITYDGTNVQNCMELTPSQTRNQPEVSYEADPQSWYLLAMVDPDASANQNGLQFLHWMVTNIPEGKVGDGDELAEYFGPSPPQDTKLHRYVFLLFKQPGKLTFDEPRIPVNSMEHRGSFVIKEFAKKYDLGNPMVVNIFRAKYQIRSRL